MDELIRKKDAVDAVNDVLAEYIPTFKPWQERIPLECALKIEALPSAQPTIVRCHECKHNPKKEWFGCPMAHLNERQRPGDAWCWKGERETE